METFFVYLYVLCFVPFRTACSSQEFSLYFVQEFLLQNLFRRIALKTFEIIVEITITHFGLSTGKKSLLCGVCVKCVKQYTTKVLLVKVIFLRSYNNQE